MSCFNQLKKTVISHKPANKLKWDEFRDITYQNFTSVPQFIQEKKFFQNFIKRLSKQFIPEGADE
jgi:hypothetical protein